MSAYRPKKRNDVNIDETEDPFMVQINKKIRNNVKKLTQIEDLEKKDKSTLKDEQLNKIKGKGEVLATLKEFEKTKDIYYEAYKIAREEGKLPNKKAAATKEEAPKEEAAPQKEEVIVPQGPTVEEIASRTLNLVLFSQLFTDLTQREEFSKKLQQANLGVDISKVYELYSRVFTFTENDRYEKVEAKLANSIAELTSYLNGSDLSNNVDAVAQSQLFREQTYNVNTNVANTQLKQDAADEPSKLEDLKADSKVIPKNEQNNHVEQAPVEQKAQNEVPANALTSEQLEAQQKEEQKTVAQTEQKEGQKDGHGHNNQYKHHNKHNKNHHYKGGHKKPHHKKEDWANHEDDDEEGQNEEKKDEWNTVKSKARGQTQPKRGGNYRGRGGRGGNRNFNNRRPEGQEGADGQDRPKTHSGYRGNYKGNRDGKTFDKKNANDAPAEQTAPATTAN